MNFSGNTRSIYIQIAHFMMDRILKGQYKSDERVPSIRQIATEMKVNANTVVRSYGFMEDLEIIYNKRGMGYFLHPNGLKNVMSFRKAELFRELPQLFKEMEMLGMEMEELNEYYQKYLSDEK